MGVVTLALVRLQSILGQTQAKALLLRSVDKGTVSHAYIFRGPSGVGKKTTALSFAAFLNCKNRQKDDFCGVCSSCMKFASENHPDFHIMEADGGSIKIAQVRELKKTLTFPPFEALYRVVLFPDIHTTMRRREVANSLLKTLEEPPANTTIILTADETGNILPTILSRGQIIRFVPLQSYEVSNKLQELKEVGENEARTLASVSGGSLGQALFLADQELLNLRRLLVDGIMDLDRGQGEAVERILSLAEQIAGLKERIYDFFSLLRLWLRDLILLASLMGEDSIVNHDLRHTYASALERWDVSDLFHRLAEIDNAKKLLERNCNRLSVCEVLLWEFL